DMTAIGAYDSDGSTPGVNLLPALLIGGPPHAGKSVLFYNLTKTLHEQGVRHHAIRACPDGEGNWYQEIHRLRQDDLSDTITISSHFIIMNFHDQNRPYRRRRIYARTADLSAWGGHRR